MANNNIFVAGHNGMVGSSILRLLLEKGQKNEVYNITSGESYDNITVVKKIANLLPVKSRNILSFVQDRPGHARAYLIDGAKISSLGWKPLESYSSGLQKTIKYYVEAGE